MTKSNKLKTPPNTAPPSDPPKRPPDGTSPLTGGQPELSITVAGAEHAVRRALTAMRLDDEWNHAVTRQIALDQTLVAGAQLDDTLGGERIRLETQDARDLYRQRCVNEAGHRGHPVPNPRDIPADTDTKIQEVGDALFEHSRH
jgi:hypothetical protein